MSCCNISCWKSTLILLLAFQTACVKISKVGIIGCGISGLGLAASLKVLRSGVDNIVIYDSREDPLQSSLGGGLQLTSGAVILDRLGLLDRLRATSNAITSLSSRNSKREALLSVNIAQLAKTIAPRQVCADDGRGDPMIYSVMRDQLMAILYDALTCDGEANSPTIKVIGKKKLLTIRENPSSKKTSLHFEDGSSDGDYDLVIGADGVNSVVRSYTSYPNQVMFDAVQPQNVASATGLRISYCVTPPIDVGASNVSEDLKSLRSGCTNSFHQWFGDGVYALIASYGAGQSLASATTPARKVVQHMLAVVYHGKDGSSDMNADWQVNPKGSRAYIQKLLVDGGLSDIPEITTMLDASFLAGGRSFDLGIRDSVVPLKKWSSDSGAIILTGDSAHPMSPFLGQGANQALQDAYYLASLIREYNRKSIGGSGSGTRRHTDNSLIDLANTFEQKRKLPTALVSAESSVLGRLETLGSPLGCLLKETVFRVLDKTGIAGLVYIIGAIPRV